jgi:hypothetical protein
MNSSIDIKVSKFFLDNKETDKGYIVGKFTLLLDLGADPKFNITDARIYISGLSLFKYKSNNEYTVLAPSTTYITHDGSKKRDEFFLMTKEIRAFINAKAVAAYRTAHGHKAQEQAPNPQPDANAINDPLSESELK